MTDEFLERHVRGAFEGAPSLDSSDIGVSVADGWLTLNGMADWEYQKDAAARAVRDLPGVKGVANSIIIQPGVNDGEGADKIASVVLPDVEGANAR